MKVLIVSTMEPCLRSEINGWGAEDSDLFMPHKPIGFTPGPSGNMYSPDTVLEALAMGWKLLAPPHRLYYDSYEWWLTKE